MTIGKEADFIRLINSKTKFRLFMLRQLPAAYFSGLRVKEASVHACTVSVPFKWFTQNPFRSTYFACLAMAAEMSTGILAMAHVYKRTPGVSMLIVGMESRFHKKAVGLTYFTCSDGAIIQAAIAQAMEKGEGQAVKAYAHGVNETGEMIAEFWITWSFKGKGKK